jgi:hypothetical protein
MSNIITKAGPCDCKPKRFCCAHFQQKLHEKLWSTPVADSTAPLTSPGAVLREGPARQIIIHLALNTSQALQAELDEVSSTDEESSDNAASDAELLRPVAIKREVSSLSSVCSTNWPNGNPAVEYVGDPAEWASSLTEALGKIDGS